MCRSTSDKSATPERGRSACAYRQTRTDKKIPRPLPSNNSRHLSRLCSLLAGRNRGPVKGTHSARSAEGVAGLAVRYLKGWVKTVCFEPPATGSACCYKTSFGHSGSSTKRTGRRKVGNLTYKDRFSTKSVVVRAFPSAEREGVSQAPLAREGHRDSLDPAGLAQLRPPV